jgi:hypothetical protein
MVDIVFPKSSAPGARPQESSGRLINAFTEKTLAGAPSDTLIRRSPGIERKAILTTIKHTRGFHDINGAAIWILNDLVVRVDPGYALTVLSTLAGTEPVTTARNNAAGGSNNVVVTENGSFHLSETGLTSDYTTGFGTPTSVCDIDGYFVFSFGDGKVVASDLNSIAVNALSYNTEQGMSVRRVVRYAGRLYAFGDKWTGVYRNVGSTPFPFLREVTIPRGIVGTHAIAGWEPGWANQLLWVGDDFVVYKLNGYTPVPVSTDDVSRDIQKAVLAGDRNLIEAFVYMFEKNAFWVLNAHNRFTWEYNVATGEWNERISFKKANWKGMKSIRMFDEWLIGDEYSGELYRVNGNYFGEGADPLIWQVESGVMSGFPAGMAIMRSSFHITSGVGSFSSVANPQVEISWSLNGGASYGAPVLRRLGGPGEYNSHPYIMNSGLSKGQGIRYRLRVSDTVHVGLSGGAIEVEKRAFAG